MQKSEDGKNDESYLLSGTLTNFVATDMTNSVKQSRDQNADQKNPMPLLFEMILDQAKLKGQEDVLDEDLKIVTNVLSNEKIMKMEVGYENIHTDFLSKFDISEEDQKVFREKIIKRIWGRDDEEAKVSDDSKSNKVSQLYPVIKGDDVYGDKVKIDESDKIESDKENGNEGGSEKIVSEAEVVEKTKKTNAPYDDKDQKSSQSITSQKAKDNEKKVRNINEKQISVQEFLQEAVFQTLKLREKMNCKERADSIRKTAWSEINSLAQLIKGLRIKTDLIEAYDNGENKSGEAIYENTYLEIIDELLSEERIFLSEKDREVFNFFLNEGKEKIMAEKMRQENIEHFRKKYLRISEDLRHYIKESKKRENEIYEGLMNEVKSFDLILRREDFVGENKVNILANAKLETLLKEGVIDRNYLESLLIDSKGPRINESAKAMVESLISKYFQDGEEGELSTELSSGSDIDEEGVVKEGIKEEGEDEGINTTLKASAPPSATEREESEQD